MPYIRAEAIRQFRVDVNLTQAELGAKLDYSTRAVIRWEVTGKVHAASLANHITLYAAKCNRVPEVNGDLVVGYIKPPATQ